MFLSLCLSLFLSLVTNPPTVVLLEEAAKRLRVAWAKAVMSDM